MDINYTKRKWATNTILTHRHGPSKYTVTFSAKELLEFSENITTCCYCGTTLDWAPDRVKNWNYPSLDRMYNTSELTLDNVDIICKKCNITKGTRTKQEFIEYCKMICDKFGDHNDTTMEIKPPGTI